MSPPCGRCAKAEIACSISLASRRSIALNSTPTGPTAWIAANWPIPAAMVGSRKIAARVTLGAISLSSSSHLAASAYSKMTKPGGIAARPRHACDEPRADRINDADKYDGHSAARLLQGRDCLGGIGQYNVRPKRDQFCRVLVKKIANASPPAPLDPHLAAVRPAPCL